MPVAQGSAEEHVDRWAKALGASRAPYRQHWPKYLFRHEEVGNASRIIRDGYLLARAHAAGYRDVAAADIIATTERAHSFARLYFRPMSPTQYRIEGIRRAEEIWHGAHAPVLVMFAFDAVSVLTANGTHFSDGNMQSPESKFGDDTEFFSGIEFGNVYHVGAFTPEQREVIVRSRCAEVLAESPLELAGRLRAIICRSPAERSYLLDLIGPEASDRWGRLVRSHTEPGIFENRWAYVDTVDVSDVGARIRFHPRLDGATCAISVRVISGENVIWNGSVAEANMSLVWTVTTRLDPGVYRLEVDVDGSTAYSAMHLVDEMPF
ncbi:DarT ssDNA thymidine ADP-ribosyltransferase family protein [Stenotrophomonas maltophilia]